MKICSAALSFFFLSLQVDAVIWSTIAVNGNHRFGTRTSAEVQTGYSDATLNELWAGASLHFGYTLSDGTWKKRTKDMHLPMHYFFIFLMYIHLYPVKDTALGILRTTSVMRMSFNFFYKNVMPLARNWNAVIDHIRWNDRLHYMNHHPFFTYLASVIWGYDLLQSPETTRLVIRSPRCKW